MRRASRHPRTFHRAELLLVALAFCLSCTGSTRRPPGEIIGTVLPEPPTPRLPVGHLVVYTEAHAYREGDTAYYPHLPYRIFDQAGELVRTVRNHRSNYDETPTRVELPAGRYLVVPERNGRGQHTIAVVIQAGRLTKVDVEAMLKTRSNR